MELCARALVEVRVARSPEDVAAHHAVRSAVFVDEQALAERFGAAGLTLARLGTLDDSGALRLRAEGREEQVWDLSRHHLTGLRPPAAR